MKNREQGIEKEEVKELTYESSRPGKDLQERLIEFAVRIVNVVESLPDNRATRHIGSQLIRAGTSPAPNYGEAQSAESRKDFVHKIKIALKELRESMVWLEIIRRKPLIENVERLDLIIDECDELISILVASANTAERNMQSAAK